MRSHGRAHPVVGVGQIGVSGTTVSFGGATIGVITSSGANGQPLTVQLQTGVTPEAAQALVRAVQFQNTGHPSAANTRSASFTLADSAFAYACNSYNLTTVASGCAIDFLAPAREGDVLSAVAHERSASGRTGVYDVEVHNQRGERIALFRGKSYRIKGHVLDAHPDAART